MCVSVSMARGAGGKDVQLGCNLGERMFKESCWFVLMSSGILGRKQCWSCDHPVYFLYLASVVLKQLQC